MLGVAGMPCVPGVVLFRWLFRAEHPRASGAVSVVCILIGQEGRGIAHPLLSRFEGDRHGLFTTGLRKGRHSRLRQCVELDWSVRWFVPVQFGSYGLELYCRFGGQVALHGEVIVVYGEAGIREDLVHHPVRFIVGLAGRVSFGTLISFPQ